MKNLQQLLKIAAKYWLFILLGFFSSILYSIFSGSGIVMLKPLMDDIFQNTDKVVIYTTSSELFAQLKIILMNFFDNLTFGNLFQIKEVAQPTLDSLDTLVKQSDSFMLLKTISAFMLISILLKNFFYFSQKTLYAIARGRTVYDVRNNLFEKYLNQSLAYFNQNRVGDFLVRIITDAKIINRDLLLNFFKIIHNSISSLIYLSIAMMINFRLMMYGLIIIPIFAIIISWLGKKIKKYSKRLQNKASDLFSFVEEILSAILVVKSFAKEKIENKNFRKVNSKYYRFWLKGQIYNSINRPISELSSTLIGIIVLLIGGHMILNNPNNGFSFGDFSAFLGYIFISLHPLKVIAKSYTKIKKGLVSLSRIYEIMNNNPEITNIPNALEKKNFKDKIEIENINFAYNPPKNVLKNINLTIKKGEQVAFVGSSGSGKTTLVKLIPRLFEIEEGSIKIDGIPIKKIQIEDLRKLFGYVTQRALLFSNSVKENIAYSDSDIISEKKYKKAAKIAFADEFIKDLDNNYETKIYSKGSNLSGGQKQRISIARAIYNNPPILIFDEATSALDTESEKKVQLAIENATQNHTVLVIAHRLSTILKSDKIVVMDSGKIVSIGKHEELLKTCTRYKKLYDLQFS